MSESQSDDFRLSALAYHHGPRPGKIEVVATKPLGTQHDLALAYTPGVAVACEAIAADPQEAARLSEVTQRLASDAEAGLRAYAELEPVQRRDGEAAPFAEGLWHDSYEAEQHLLQFGRAEEPVCWTLTGFASIS